MTDNETIVAAIKEAKNSGVDRVLIPKRTPKGSEEWIIQDTIYIPSDIELLLDGAVLKLAPNTFINMFVNENVRLSGERTPENRQKNIVIRGRENAVIDGGGYNGLSEKNSEKDGLPHISKNTPILFVNCSGIVMENIKIQNQRWWGITNIFVSDSVFRSLSFKSDFSSIDENGVVHPDVLPKDYASIAVKNSDGIDLRVGCHDILIENISGFTEDDSVALTALGDRERALGYLVSGESTDIRCVAIRNVCTQSVCSNVRLLNDCGNKLYDIAVDGVVSLPLAEYGRRTSYAVRIGDTAYCNKDNESVLGDTKGISIRNVVSSAVYAVSLCKGLTDSVIENVTVFGDGCAFGVARDRYVHAEVRNVTLQNVLLAEEGSCVTKAEELLGELVIL